MRLFFLMLIFLGTLNQFRQFIKLSIYKTCAVDLNFKSQYIEEPRMQSFKISKSELSTLMRDFNTRRKESLKNIKQFYTQIEAKQSNIFDNALERLEKNLQQFKQTKYKKMHNQIDHKVILGKYEGKLQKIDGQIAKLDQIIKNGCGKIVQKPLTSRISINSNVDSKDPSQSRRSIQSISDRKIQYLTQENRKNEY